MKSLLPLIIILSLLLAGCTESVDRNDPTVVTGGFITSTDGTSPTTTTDGTEFNNGEPPTKLTAREALDIVYKPAPGEEPFIGEPDGKLFYRYPNSNIFLYLDGYKENGNYYVLIKYENVIDGESARSVPLYRYHVDATTGEITSFPIDGPKLTAREALDIVYKPAPGEEPLISEFSGNPYYIISSGGNYFLRVDNYNEKGNYYLLQEYEFVLDDPDAGMGHTVTYNWYKVDASTGEVISFYIIDENGDWIFNEDF